MPADVIGAIVRFLRERGIAVSEEPVDEATVLPGIAVRAGTLCFDPAKLTYPGDLLHEAGHLAMMTPAARARATGSFPGSGGAEMGALAWSYAACVDLGFEPTVVFHDDGYRGGARALVAAFAAGGGVGVPILRWLGLAGNDYPAMLRWTNESANEP
jgi:hypothetical protein